jgi:hypothetical protein
MSLPGPKSSSIVSTAASSLVPLNKRRVVIAFDVEVASTIITGTYYLLSMDAASLPSNGAVNHFYRPVELLLVNGVTTTVSKTFEAEGGRLCQSGLVFALSTTRATLTVYTTVSTLTCDVTYDEE